MHFCMKKMSIKCWWNWHLYYIESVCLNNCSISFNSYVIFFLWRWRLDVWKTFWNAIENVRWQFEMEEHAKTNTKLDHFQILICYTFFYFFFFVLTWLSWEVKNLYLIKKWLVFLDDMAQCKYITYTNTR